MAQFDPRPDERPPTYYKGQWFGGVPHTRIILLFPSATGDLAALQGGVVLDAVAYVDSDPNDAIAQWGGILNIAGGELFFTYSWDCVDTGSGEAVTECTVSTFPGGIPQWQGFRTYVPFRPADRIPFEVGLPNYDQDFGTTAAKVEVPEWSNVVDYWPDALSAPWPF